MKQAKATIVTQGDDSTFLVTETPSEVATMVEDAFQDGREFIQLTAGNTGDWHGKPFFIRVKFISGIMPPMDHRCDEEVT